MADNHLKIIKQISDVFKENNLNLSVAESCTGGAISNFITNLPGASGFFSMSIVCYSIESKRTVLGIRASLLKKYGTVSEETAIAMAKSVRKISKTDVSLAITGVAGPESVEDKDVGLVYMAAAAGDLIESKGMRFTGSREEIKDEAAYEALKFLQQVLRIWF